MTIECEKCGQDIPEPKHVWLSTQQVIETYGFDPRPYIVEPSMKSKLMPVPSVYSPGDSALLRVWLKESIEAKAAELMQ